MNAKESPPGASSPPAAPNTASVPRPLYWSVRRELWENRSLYIAPSIAAAVVLLGFLLGAFTLPHSLRMAEMLDPALQGAALAKPYSFAAFAVMVTSWIVAVFYCLDALYGERRDRSILFWKSLPVSDLTTVLSKAGIPLVILPLLAFTIIIAVQLSMLLLSTVVLLTHGGGVALLWTQLPLLQMALVLLYSLLVLSLWNAPIYAWLLLVSGWARRSTFLWATLPLIAICVLERTALHSSHFLSMLHYRLTGGVREAFTSDTAHSYGVLGLAQIDPGKFLRSPGLWSGLAVAAVFLAAATRLRRNREPI